MSARAERILERLTAAAVVLGTVLLVLALAQCAAIE